MKKITFLFLVFAAMACHSSKEAAKPVAASAEAPATPPTPAQGGQTAVAPAPPSMAPAVEQTRKPEENMYRMIISMISIGEGTDSEGRTIMDRVLNTWQYKKGTPIVVETYPWGREGEVDFCFRLYELTEAEQKEFVAEMKKAFEGHKLIQISENEECKHIY